MRTFLAKHIAELRAQRTVMVARRIHPSHRADERDCQLLQGRTAAEHTRPHRLHRIWHRKLPDPRAVLKCRRPYACKTSRQRCRHDVAAILEGIVADIRHAVRHGYLRQSQVASRKCTTPYRLNAGRQDGEGFGLKIAAVLERIIANRLQPFGESHRLQNGAILERRLLHVRDAAHEGDALQVFASVERIPRHKRVVRYHHFLQVRGEIVCIIYGTANTCVIAPF